jgi:hypothetical protein
MTQIQDRYAVARVSLTFYPFSPSSYSARAKVYDLGLCQPGTSCGTVCTSTTPVVSLPLVLAII